jgi:ABC-type lipoprotein export system ATPase subunit
LIVVEGPLMVTTKQLSKTYSHGAAVVTALRDVSLEVKPGEFCAFVGPSGCGKSTLLNLVAGLDLPTSGEIRLDGRSTQNLTSSEWTKIRRETIGIVFQAFHLVHGLTAEENIALPLMLRGENGREMAKRVNDMLDKVGMSHRRRHRPAELSGGEQQRIAIARALVHGPRLLLADEPTGNIDSHQGAGIMALIRELAISGGQTVLLVTHSIQAAQAADYVWTMRDGRLVSRIERMTELVIP